jgi:hypothetical protein
MVLWQVGELKETDNQVRAVNKAYQALPDNVFIEAFYDQHHEALRLGSRRAYKGVGKGLARGR